MQYCIFQSVRARACHACLCFTLYFTVNTFKHLINARPKQLANIIFLLDMNKLTMHWFEVLDSIAVLNMIAILEYFSLYFCTTLVL